MNYDTIMKKLKSMSNPKAVEGMARYGITPHNAYGISMPDLRKMAKEIGVNHSLAQQLWVSGVHEARILASIVAASDMVTEEQAEDWVRDFDSWDVCDQVCMNLLENTRFAYEKAIEWSSKEEEFVKRAGFALMARLAVSDKMADNKKFEAFLPIIEQGATDNRNYVKKAVNWALRQIGKRNLYLNKKSIDAAGRIQKTDSKSARWIAADAIRELTSPAVQRRLRD
jgi:3-methyladenine DNA glycosylase AlkD